MSLITFEDFRDIYLKINQRGLSFLLSKISTNPNKRTKSSFNDIKFEHANWWIIPAVRKRWNLMITGNENISYEEFISDNYFDKEKNLKMVSYGSGVCSHELKLAELNPNLEILCIDFSEILLKKAKEEAVKKKLTNIRFLKKDVYKCNIENNSFDFVFFHASLHHFKSLHKFIPRMVTAKLKKRGKLIIHEYVGPNRMQFPNHQIKAINEGISLIDSQYKTLFKSKLKKNKYYGSGSLRMLISDPSECVDSEHILPIIHDSFTTILERPFGGNILMNVLKDIAHNFINLNEKSVENIQKLFDYEDEYLKNNSSDFMFGIYQKG